jgi:xanthine dehydrogenase iron-sulfur cluster and FAD-binding subunit A
MIISAVALLKKNPMPKENEIVDFMDGNVCRCGTYPRIVSAIQKAAKAMGARGALDGGEPNAQLLRRQERDASRGSLRSFAAQKRLAQDDNDVLTGSSASAAKGAGR